MNAQEQRADIILTDKKSHNYSTATLRHEYVECGTRAKIQLDNRMLVCARDIISGMSNDTRKKLETYELGDRSLLHSLSNR